METKAVDFAIYLNKNGFTLRDSKGNKKRIYPELVKFGQEQWKKEINITQEK